MKLFEKYLYQIGPIMMLTLALIVPFFFSTSYFSEYHPNEAPQIRIILEAYKKPAHTYALGKGSNPKDEILIFKDDFVKIFHQNASFMHIIDLQNHQVIKKKISLSSLKKTDDHEDKIRASKHILRQLKKNPLLLDAAVEINGGVEKGISSFKIRTIIKRAMINQIIAYEKGISINKTLFLAEKGKDHIVSHYQVFVSSLTGKYYSFDEKYKIINSASTFDSPNTKSNAQYRDIHKYNFVTSCGKYLLINPSPEEKKDMIDIYDVHKNVYRGSISFPKPKDDKILSFTVNYNKLFVLTQKKLLVYNLHLPFNLYD